MFKFWWSIKFGFNVKIAGVEGNFSCYLPEFLKPIIKLKTYSNIVLLVSFNFCFYFCSDFLISGEVFGFWGNMFHGLFLERVYKIELDTKTEYEGF